MIEVFLTYLRCELNYSAHTVAAYDCDLHQFAEWLDDFYDNDRYDIVPDKVTLKDLRGWLGQLARDGYAPRSIRRKTLAVKSYFHFLHKTGRISRNPVSDITLTKIDSPLPHVVKADEMEQVLSGERFDTSDFPALRDLIVIDILYSTGIRRAELIGLRDADINFLRGEIKVTGKRNKQRIIPIGNQLIERIRRYQELRDNLFINPLCDKLIVTNTGKEMNNYALRFIVNKELASTSAGKKTPHVLRHSFATELINHGAEINSVKELLGHSSLSTTQIYTHLSLNELRNNYKLAHPRVRTKK